MPFYFYWTVLPDFKSKEKGHRAEVLEENFKPWERELTLVEVNSKPETPSLK